MSTIASQPSATRSERAERTRHRILDAAGQCFAASGYAKTTVEEIALHAAVSKALVYHHFRGKEQILEAVLERTLADWDEATQTANWPEGKSALQGLAEMHRGTLRYARDNPLVRALFQNDPLVLLNMRGSAAVRRSLGYLPSKEFFLFGTPTKHSPSPAIHNAGFEANGCGHTYGTVETDEAPPPLDPARQRLAASSTPLDPARR